MSYYYRHPINSQRVLKTRNLKEAREYCQVDQVNLSHPQSAIDRAWSLGYSKGYACAAYRRTDDLCDDLYLTSGKMIKVNIAVDVRETVDESQVVLGMASNLDELAGIVGGKTATIGNIFRSLSSGTVSSVEVGNFTVVRHSPEVAFVPGVAPNMQGRINNLKLGFGVGLGGSIGKFAIFQHTRENKEYWERRDEGQDHRIMTHASSANRVTKLVSKGSGGTFHSSLKNVLETGVALDCTNKHQERFTIHRYDSSTHGVFDDYEWRKKRAEEDAN